MIDYILSIDKLDEYVATFGYMPDGAIGMALVVLMTREQWDEAVKPSKIRVKIGYGNEIFEK